MKTVIYDSLNYETDEEMTWGEIQEELRFDWEDFEAELQKLADGYCGIVCDGTIGAWDGRHPGGAVCRDVDELIRCGFRDCLDMRVVDEDGDLEITGYHHDGSVTFGIRFLTGAGYELLEENEGCVFCRGYAPSVKAVFDDPRYTEPVRFAELAWGIPA